MENVRRTEINLQVAWITAAAQQLQQNLPPGTPTQLELLDENNEDHFDQWLEQRKRKHERAFPFSENLLAMFHLVLAELSADQRERITMSLTLEGKKLTDYTQAMLREKINSMLVANKTSLQTPHLNQNSRGQRSYLILDEGTLDGFSGYWVEDDETGEEGFTDPAEEVFWTFDDENECWIARRTYGRRFRRGQSKGKGRGKSGKKRSYAKGRKRFKPYGQRKKNRAHYGDGDEEQPEEPEDAWKAKGKSKGKSKDKGGGGKPPPWAKGQPSVSPDQAQKAKGKSKGKGKRKGKGWYEEEGQTDQTDQSATKSTEAQGSQDYHSDDPGTWAYICDPSFGEYWTW